MKVAVLDLGSLFAKIFKASVQPPVVASPVASASSGSASSAAATGPADSSVGNAGSSASTVLSAAQTVTLFPTVAPKSPTAPRVPSVSLSSPAILHPLLTASYPRVSSVRKAAEVAGAPFSLPSSPRAARLPPLPLPHSLSQSQPLLSSQSQPSSQFHAQPQLQPVPQPPAQPHLQLVTHAQSQTQPLPQLPSQPLPQPQPQSQPQFQPLSQPHLLSLSQSLPLSLPQPHLQLLPLPQSQLQPLSQPHSEVQLQVQSHPQPPLQPLFQTQSQFLPQLQPQPQPLPLLHSPVQPLALRGSGGGGSCSNNSGANSPALPLSVALWRPPPGPGGLGAVLQPITGTGGSNSGLAASPARSPRQPGPGEREPGARIVPGQGPKTLLFTLPDIGEEWGTDIESEDDGSSETKGLAEGPGQQHLTVKSRDPLPKHFTKNVQEAIHNYNCESISSLLSSGNTTPTDLNNSWSGIQSITTERSTSTERSSVSSWTDDEFDKATAKKVQQLFWEVDEMLFEGKISPHCQNLQAECKEWTRRSLHLRVLGKQLMFPTDEGFQHFPSNAASSAHIKSSLDLCESNNNLKELCISGSKLVPEDYTRISSVLSDIAASFLEEEIYDIDGEIEEYFAFDKKEFDDESLEPKKAVISRPWNKHGVPPISPEDCIKDAAAAEAFDHAWRNVVEMLEELVRKTWETAPQGGSKQRENLKTAGNKLAKLPSAHIPPNPSSVPPSRGSETHSTSLGSHMGLSQNHRFSSSFYNDLNGVMTIQAKPLQQRHTHFADRTPHDQGDRLLVVGSSVLSSTRHRLGQVSDYSVLSSSRPLPMSARKTPVHRRLPSLSSDLHQSKTSNVHSDKVLRGNKLHIGSDCLSSPSVQVPRNRLPPISSEAGEQNTAPPGSRQAFHRGRHPQNQVLSAVPGNIETPPLRERTVISEQFSRPNTTQTFRSDTPHKRSLTPMEFGSHMWTGQGFLTGSQHLPKSYQRNTSTSRRRFPVAS
ncbi:protein FAM149A isoform X2 [Phascolarctos cinereus]|uniref:Protein FAM149A n=1 Tax=Phascolarctos cinereus TaxID=38626 RepID=A0A6P5LXU9_PHACI|nr:protein FAM149A [Phascolarctos cinereus]